MNAEFKFPQPFLLNKLTAARRQLNEAIYLFFNGRDIVAVHTLAAAAHGILDTLAKKSGIAESSKSQVEALIPDDELRKWFHTFWKKPENFLKHADRDPDETHEFRPQNTYIVLFDAVQLYNSLTGEKCGPGLIFLTWFVLKHRLGEQLKDKFTQTVVRTCGHLDPEDFPSWAEVLKLCW